MFLILSVGGLLRLTCRLHLRLRMLPVLSRGAAPRVCLYGERFGGVSGEALRSTSASSRDTDGLPAGIPIVMAPYDIVTTAYGCGAVAPGQACVILGTTICAEAIVRSIEAAIFQEPQSLLAMGSTCARCRRLRGAKCRSGRPQC